MILIATRTIEIRPSQRWLIRMTFFDVCMRFMRYPIVIVIITRIRYSHSCELDGYCGGAEDRKP